MRWSNCATAASALSAIATLSSGALAQSAADFYKGKTVTYIVAIGPGGGADFFGRLATRHMQRVMPDTQFIVKNARRRRGGAGQGDPIYRRRWCRCSRKLRARRKPA